jgi:hypothetical protein
MRRFKRTYIVVGLALLGTLAFAATSWAPHPGHVFTATFTATPPKGFPKDKPQPGVLDVALAGTDDPATPNPAPPRATVINLDVDKSVKLSGKGLPVCPHGPASVGGDGALEGTPATGPGSAQALCGNEAPDKDDNALVGTGAATAQIGTSVVSGTALAFNGTNNSILIHVRIDALSTTVVVPGTIGTAPDQSLYGQRVTFLPPAIAGGAGSLSSISLNLTRIEKIKKKGKAGASASKKKKKKYASIVSGKCTDGTFNFQNVEDYADHETIQEAVTQPCQQGGGK